MELRFPEGKIQGWRISQEAVIEMAPHMPLVWRFDGGGD